MARTPLRCPNRSLPNSNKVIKSIGGIREKEQQDGCTPNYSPRARSRDSLTHRGI
jgi:hypothetical protein